MFLWHGTKKGCCNLYWNSENETYLVKFNQKDAATKQRHLAKYGSFLLLQIRWQHRLFVTCHKKHGLIEDKD